ncbi:hypothetical protein BH160DRAFT_6580 [Burkholderia sp. H160]|nr:hypothetical protein BH160DRAFT_6580 [Burkholderia sp. H160]
MPIPLSFLLDSFAEYEDIKSILDEGSAGTFWKS